eukprot:336338-Rhodomonas_salina.1
MAWSVTCLDTPSFSSVYSLVCVTWNGGTSGAALTCSSGEDALLSFSGPAAATSIERSEFEIALPPPASCTRSIVTPPLPTMPWYTVVSSPPAAPLLTTTNEPDLVAFSRWPTASG